MWIPGLTVLISLFRAMSLIGVLLLSLKTLRASLLHSRLYRFPYNATSAAGFGSANQDATSYSITQLSLVVVWHQNINSV